VYKNALFQRAFFYRTDRDICYFEGGGFFSFKLYLAVQNNKYLPCTLKKSPLKKGIFLYPVKPMPENRQL
jgi:hypothetical protein